MHVARIVIGMFTLGLLTAVTPTPGHADPLKCKATITKSSSQYVQARTKALAKCEGSVVAGKLPPGTDCPNETKASAAIIKAKGKLAGAIAKACGGADKTCGGADDDSLASIGWNVGTCPNIDTHACAMAIGTCQGVGDCVECVDAEAVDQAVTLYFDALAPSGTDKTLNKCQQTIGKAAAGFLATKAKTLAKCWDGVNKGAFPGPCPAPGDGKAAAAIMAAETKAITTICKACGGDDKGCDAAVNGAGVTVPGTGGSDDLTPAAIGFPASCADLTVPGGPSCNQTITTLADLVECVDCITEYKVDCTDRLAVPWAGAYPGECNPRCGNGILEAGEICDTPFDSACPGECAPAIVADGCTCPTGTFSIAAVGGGDLDTGWTGISHNQPLGTGRLFDARTYGCSSAGPDQDCSFVAAYTTPYFGPPLALSSGGIPICVLNEVVGTTAGVLNLTTGALTYDYSLISRVFTGISLGQPCPTCVGDVTVDDDVKDGTCDGGPNAGTPCDADGVSASFGATSFDCTPLPGANIGNLPITFDDATTGTKTRTLSTSNPTCVGFPTARCFCDTCNNLAADPCASNADCPVSGGLPGICSGRRCVNGTNAGAPCADVSECPGGACGRPGTSSKPNACDDDAGTEIDGTVCVDTGDGVGVCPDGPLDGNCAPPEQFRGCESATQATDCPLTGLCLGANRPCFPDTVTRTGTPGPLGGTYAGEFCISPTGASAVNSTAGLPGLGALLLNYSLSINVP